MTRKTKAQLEQAVQSLEQALKTANDALTSAERNLHQARTKMGDPKHLCRAVVQAFIWRAYHTDDFWLMVKTFNLLNDRDGLMGYVLRSEEFVIWMKENYP